MVISDIRTHLLSVPYRDPPKIGVADYSALEAKINLLVVEVETKSGVIGTGHLHPVAGGMRTLETCIHEMLKPLLIGEEATSVEALWQKMWRATYIQGRMGITVMAMSALDVALWDAVGRHAGKPLWELWGGSGDALPIYGSGCFRGLGHDGMIEKAKRYVDRGFAAIKMQVGHVFTEDEDVANVRDMRQELGSGIGIMLDVNQGWTADEAIRVGSRLDEFDLAWLEEPVLADDFEGYHRVADAIQTPVVGGENHFTHHDFKPFFASRKIPIIQPDIMRGGYTELKVIANQAHDVGIKMAPHLFYELNSHLNACIPNPMWLEYMGWFDHLWVNPALPENGLLKPPTRPGHGFDFKPELFTEFPYQT